MLSKSGTVKLTAEQKDPYLKYGIGIKNYFLLQGQLIKSFCILSIFAVIQMIIMG